MEQVIIIGALTLALILGIYAIFSGSRTKGTRGRQNSSSRSTNVSSRSSTDRTSDNLAMTDGGVSNQGNNNEIGELPIPDSPPEPSGPDLEQTENDLKTALTGLQAIMPRGQGGQPMVVINNSQQQQQQQMVGGPGQSFLPPALNGYGNPFMPVHPMPSGQTPVPPITPPGNGEPEVPEKVPEPAPLLKMIKQLEEPTKAFVLMSEAGEKDLEKLTRKATKLEKKKNKERKIIEKLNTKLEEAEKELDKIDNAQVDSSKASNVRKDLLTKIDTIESKVEELEDKQNSYEKLLSNEDKELVKLLKQNAKALQDVDTIINTLDKLAKSTELIAPLIETAEDKEKIKLSDKEISEIEKFVEKMLDEEKRIVEKIEALKRKERETEHIEEQELEEIQKLLEEDKRLKTKLKQAQKHGNITKEEYNKIVENINKLAKLLKKLGVEIEEEEKLEEDIVEDASKGEEKLSQQEKEDEEDLEQAEGDTRQAQKKADNSTGRSVRQPWEYIVENDNAKPKIVEVEKTDKNGNTYTAKELRIIDVNENRQLNKEEYKGDFEFRPEWIYNRGNISDLKQGWKIHIAVNADNEEEVNKVAREIIPVMEQTESLCKIAISKRHLKRKGGETEEKLATFYPAKSNDELVNGNKGATEKIIVNLLNRLYKIGILETQVNISTIGEFYTEFKGTKTRIWTRYDRINPNKDNYKPLDVDGNVANPNRSGRKPGVVPENFEQEFNTSIKWPQITEMKGLTNLFHSNDELEIILPKSNISEN